MSSSLGASAAIALATTLVCGAVAHEVYADPPLGRWQVVRGEFGGRPITTRDLPNGTMHFDVDGHWEGTEHGKVTGGGTWIVDESEVPATMDLRHTAGLDQGKTQLCRYAVVGDSLTLVLGVPGERDRPSALATVAESKPAILFVLVRVR